MFVSVEKCVHLFIMYHSLTLFYAFKVCKCVHTAKYVRVKDFNFYPSLNKVSGSRIFVLTLFLRLSLKWSLIKLIISGYLVSSTGSGVLKLTQSYTATYRR